MHKLPSQCNLSAPFDIEGRERTRPGQLCVSYMMQELRVFGQESGISAAGLHL